ncbi:MAG: hypothetical protein NDI94_04880, partial [Candidatus Woesearchaeota archaeon]|nr:hypothetical protein [Candidatus Woesearchaeota archaeon]
INRAVRTYSELNLYSLEEVSAALKKREVKNSSKIQGSQFLEGIDLILSPKELVEIIRNRSYYYPNVTFNWEKAPSDKIYQILFDAIYQNGAGEEYLRKLFSDIVEIKGKEIELARIMDAKYPTLRFAKNATLTNLPEEVNTSAIQLIYALTRTSSIIYARHFSKQSYEKANEILQLNDFELNITYARHVGELDVLRLEAIGQRALNMLNEEAQDLVDFILQNSDISHQKSQYTYNIESAYSSDTVSLAERRLNELGYSIKIQSKDDQKDGPFVSWTIGLTGENAKSSLMNEARGLVNLVRSYEYNMLRQSSDIRPSKEAMNLAVRIIAEEDSMGGNFDYELNPEGGGGPKFGFSFEPIGSKKIDLDTSQAKRLVDLIRSSTYSAYNREPQEDYTEGAINQAIRILEEEDQVKGKIDYNKHRKSSGGPIIGWEFKPINKSSRLAILQDTADVEQADRLVNLVLEIGPFNSGMEPEEAYTKHAISLAESILKKTYGYSGSLFYEPSPTKGDRPSMSWHLKPVSWRLEQEVQQESTEIYNLAFNHAQSFKINLSGKKKYHDKSLKEAQRLLRADGYDIEVGVTLENQTEYLYFQFAEDDATPIIDTGVKYLRTTQLNHAKSIKGGLDFVESEIRGLKNTSADNFENGYIFGNRLMKYCERFFYTDPERVMGFLEDLMDNRSLFTPKGIEYIEKLWDAASKIKEMPPPNFSYLLKKNLP